MNIVVVGASSSVGQHLVARLRDERHRVIEADRPDLEITDEESIEEFVEKDLPDPLHAMVILSGICPGKNLDEYRAEEINEVMKVNCTGPIRLVKHVRPRLARNGRIVLMSSISGVNGSYDPIYAASKAALIAFAQSVACVTALAPDLIENSSMYLAMGEENRQRHRKRSKTGRLTQFVDVSNAIVAILSSVETSWGLMRVSGGVAHVD